MKPLSLNIPHVIMMVGIPGAGKSFFANHFAQTFSAPIISYHSISPLSSDSHATRTLTAHMLSELLKTGRTIVYDGASSTRADRQALVKLARNAGYETSIVWVQTESTAAKQRSTKQYRDRPYLTSEQFEARLRHFTAPNPAEKAIVISGKHTYASQLKIILGRLVSSREIAQNERPPTAERPIVRRVILR